ncbi:MAG: aspartate ammonia-lyase [Candidatus Omnitrophica bacterium]|nr:aspartate ammonia-lyase [Candidatus Omnitrophota bacterium]
MKNRIEKDNLGEMEIQKDKLWGIQTQRALENFKLSGYKIDPEFIKALAVVKKACCLANKETGYLDEKKSAAIVSACDEIIKGEHICQFPLDALQGGAGTSLNMNMNEVITNIALQKIGRENGEYCFIHPLDDVNKHQSTNDVFPTALKVAVIKKLNKLSGAIEKTQGVFQAKEKEFAGILKVGRTEMQIAVPMTLGAELSAFACAIARDRWRVFKCTERIRQVNLGGTAIGSGLTAPRKYIFLVIEKLRELTGYGLTRGENLIDETANSDSFVEIAGILKANASNIIKISNDLRILNMLGEIILEPLQAGSSIMPGKVNPVILEASIQGALKASADCNIVFESASRSSLEINEFMPLLAFSILEAINILIEVNAMLGKHVEHIKADKDKCLEYLDNDPIIITAFLPVIGYEKCEELVNEYCSKKNKYKNVKEFLSERLGNEQVDTILTPANIMALGHKDGTKNT